MGQLATKDAKLGTIRDLLLKNMKSIGSVAPRHLTPEKICRVAFESIRKNPALLECDGLSLLNCIMAAAQCGLTTDGAQQHAHLIPYKQHGKPVCTLIPGYRGLMEIAMRHPKVLAFVPPTWVYSNERFIHTIGLHPVLEHTPLPPSERGDLVAVYQVAYLRDAEPVAQVMWYEEIKAVGDAVKARSAKSGYSTPWDTDFEAMGMKTVCRRLCKWLPSSAELTRAVQMDEAAERGELPTFDFEIIDSPAKSKPKTLADTIPTSALPTPEPETLPDDGQATEAVATEATQGTDAPPVGEEPDARRKRLLACIRDAYRKMEPSAKLKALRNWSLDEAQQIADLPEEQLAQIVEALG